MPKLTAKRIAIALLILNEIRGVVFVTLALWSGKGLLHF
jgi:hypothetical protein